MTTPAPTTVQPTATDPATWFRLDGKAAIVTGAGSGIGRSIASTLAAAVWERDENAGQQTAQQLRSHGLNAAFVPCDVTDHAGVQHAMQQTTDALGPVRLLVNNAGISHVGNLEKTSPDDMDRLYRVNVKGVYHVLQQAVPHMVQQGGGAIVNLASIASLTGVKDRFAYSMTKGAVLTMTYSVAIDYVQHNIRCNCVCPARVHTPFVDNFLKQHYPGHEDDMFQKLAQYQPVGRMGTPDEVAALTLFLLSDQARFITAAAYPLDGGVINAR